MRLDKATQQWGNSAKGRQESETHLLLMFGAHKNIKLTGVTIYSENLVQTLSVSEGPYAFS